MSDCSHCYSVSVRSMSSDGTSCTGSTVVICVCTYMYSSERSRGSSMIASLTLISIDYILPLYTLSESFPTGQAARVSSAAAL